MPCKIVIEEGTERKMREIKAWAEHHEFLKGRSDSNFLLMFLRSCDIDVELTKKTIELYYHNRDHKPEWWADRDLNQPRMKQVLNQRIFTALKDSDPEQPVITIFQINRVGSNSRMFDDIVKGVSVVLDVVARRKHCQLHGHTCLVDLANVPWWLSLKVLSPVLVKNYCNSFVIFSFGSDWSNLGDVLPVEVLPEEYGGLKGPMKEHEDEFVKEMMAFNEYLMEDSKYGFQETKTIP